MEGENLMGNLGGWTNGGRGGYQYNPDLVAHRSGIRPLGDAAQPAISDHGEYPPLYLEPGYPASPAGLRSRPGVPTLGGAAESASQLTDALRGLQPRNIHSVRQADANDHRCSSCRKTFKNARALRRHSRYHDPVQDQHQCEACDYSSPLPKDLKRHKKTHAGIHAPVRCLAPGCPKSYPRRDNMLRHFRTKHASNPDPSVSLGPPETHFFFEGQTAASEYNFAGSTSVQPDAEAPLYQEGPFTEPTNLSSYSGYGSSSYPDSEQTTGSLYPFVNLQQLDLRNSSSLHEPVDLRRDAAAGDDDDSSLTPWYGSS